MTRVVALALALLTASAAAADGESVCLNCHAADRWDPGHGAHRTDGALSHSTCTDCHGGLGRHLPDPRAAGPAVSFGPNHPASADVQTRACINCHDGGALLGWEHGAHAGEDLTCGACHSVHALPTASATASADAWTGGLGSIDSHDATCLGCHGELRAQLRAPSRHPILEGRTACTSCHDPHGGKGPTDLREATLNTQCLTCHPAQRGPWLFDHPPVSEDCSLCHAAHGSMHSPLLIRRSPQLCQDCHVAAFHPSEALGADGLAGASPNASMLGRDCMNCHSRVHGTNHPAGGRLTR